MTVERRCPDCGVTMNEHDIYTGGGQFDLRTDESTEGILGSLGAKERLSVSPYHCPECGLVRFYAEE